MLSSLPFDRHVEAENRSVIRSGVYPNIPAQALDDTLADSESDSGAWNLAAMQAAKDLKNRLAMLRGNAHAVIFN